MYLGWTRTFYIDQISLNLIRGPHASASQMGLKVCSTMLGKNLSVCLSARLSIYLSSYLPIYLPTYLLICLFQGKFDTYKFVCMVPREARKGHQISWN